MCTPLNEYRDYLTRLVTEKSPLLFSNGGKEYASILMSILLDNTTKSVCMFCEGFKPDLIMENDYWQALNRYLNKTEKSLRVLVNSDEYINEKPLQTLFEKKKDGNGASIEVRLINKKGREKIQAQFNGELNNFAVFDDNMYRLEYVPQDYKAIGSFNCPKDTQLLLRLFNEVFEQSSEINGTTA